MSSTIFSFSGTAAGACIHGGASDVRKIKFFQAPRKLFGECASGDGIRKAQKLGMVVPSFSRELSFSCSAIGSNVSEDTDDMFDDLFKKYGKVVYQSKDQKPTTAEIDDDAEIAVEMAKVASDVKAADIKVLFVKPLVQNGGLS
ncbi:hypothetical protein V2J09_008262 [Rumex salicifolius]